ncbi:MAG TPA: hypothetical protein PL066_03990 [bacterium]|nr:hypothetical protein [bacterium]
MPSFKIPLLLTSVFLLSACISVSPSTSNIQPTPIDELDVSEEFVFVGQGFQNDYVGRCVSGANEFVRQFCDDDNDGLLNYQEVKYRTDSKNADTDHDGYLDGEEILKAYNPLGFGDLVPEKYRYCERPSQYWCWQAQAYYRADAKYCEQIDKKYTSAIGTCLQRAADQKAIIDRVMFVSNWNYDDCDSISSESEKLLCQKELAYALGGLNQSKRYCQDKFGFLPLVENEVVSHERELQHRCWYAAAVSTGDWQMCGDLDMHIIKDFDRISCVTEIARLNNDSEICYKLNDLGAPLGVSRCLGEKAVPTNQK